MYETNLQNFSTNSEFHGYSSLLFSKAQFLSSENCISDERDIVSKVYYSKPLNIETTNEILKYVTKTITQKLSIKVDVELAPENLSIKCFAGCNSQNMFLKMCFNQFKNVKNSMNEMLLQLC